MQEQELEAEDVLDQLTLTVDSPGQSSVASKNHAMFYEFSNLRKKHVLKEHDVPELGARLVHVLEPSRTLDDAFGTEVAVLLFPPNTPYSAKSAVVLSVDDEVQHHIVSYEQSFALTPEEEEAAILSPIPLPPKKKVLRLDEFVSRRALQRLLRDRLLQDTDKGPKLIPEELDLGWSVSLGKEDVDALCRVLANTPCSIKRLVLSQHDLQPVLGQLLEAMDVNQSLTSLDLGSTNIGELAKQAADHLGSTHKRSTKSDDQFFRLAYWLGSGDCMLQRLDLSGNLLSAGDGHLLAAMLPRNTCLTSLKLAHMNINAWASELALAFRNCHSLAEVDLSHCNLQPDTAFAVAVFTQRSPSIKKMNVGDNILGYVGSYAMLLLSITRGGGLG